jgi:carbonic anhydrase
MQRSPSIDWSRRRLMAAFAAAPLIAAGLPGKSRAAGPGPAMSGDAARQALAAGNGRYVAGTPRHIDYPSRREAVAPGQMPFAIVLGCADSRVPPEIVFDQGLGDVFTLRVAGNVADELALGSMEYAVEHFATPLIVVLGHERCGAVSAAVAALAHGTMPPPHIASLVKAIRPAVEASKGMPGDPVENAIRANVRHTVAALGSSHPVLAEAVARHRLEIVGAEYHLASGRVEFMA